MVPNDILGIASRFTTRLSSPTPAFTRPGRNALTDGRVGVLEVRIQSTTHAPEPGDGRTPTPELPIRLCLCFAPGRL
jgi:hypothetical protein